MAAADVVHSRHCDNSCLVLQELVLNAGQVVELPASDYVGTASGDPAKTGQKKAPSSVSDVLDKPPVDVDSHELSWKVQVSDLQVAFLSTRWLGTAQLVADDCNITHSIKNATEFTDVRLRSRTCSPPLRSQFIHLGFTGLCQEPHNA
jgi:hypothetical protein